MLTAAVRDLHRSYPGEFATDVRTCFPDLWENNPYITSLREEDPEVRQIACSYPLINKANQGRHHCLEGFIHFLNERLGLAIRLSDRKGDIHLSTQEKAWYSQVHEVTGEDTPFWIVSAGGKYDITIKWWDSTRFQEVIDSFEGKIQFVQIGQAGHHHPKLSKVIDLRGQTSLRELIRLIYHSQGVLCPVTSLMHLAAAVPLKIHASDVRPCVVIAGGREPAEWERYTGHRFMHTMGQLKCCTGGGCWRDRTFKLRDGNRRDRPESLCVDVKGHLPRCMDVISSARVIRNIHSYFRKGLPYLTQAQAIAARRGVKATRKNEFDKHPLNLQSAGLACDRFVSEIGAYPGGHTGRGIVICAGGVQYFTNAWVCINRLRASGCRLPIELWYRNSKEFDKVMRTLVSGLGVECINAEEKQLLYPHRIGGGWGVKAYALLYSRFQQVLLLDADNLVVRDPEFLFQGEEFLKTGAIFWPDYDHPKTDKKIAVWRSCGIRIPPEPEFESGQIVVDKTRCWKPLNLALWFNANSDFYYQYLHGDKETFHLAFRKLKQPYSLVPWRIHSLTGTMCQHDFAGQRLFQHRNTLKWTFEGENPRVPDFWYEDECLAYLEMLRSRWSGVIGKAEGDAPTANHKNGQTRSWISPQQRARRHEIDGLKVIA
jgi:hypothetical protein